jgi:ribosomal protein S18 acetylase RimI-like enzyme
MKITFRPAMATDYQWIIEAVDVWWGRTVSPALPRLFLDNFQSTSLVAESSGQPVGFLVGFLSPSITSTAYIHFVAVDPAFRGLSIARRMYERFFEIAANGGRTEVKSITAPTNAESIEFHRSLGFSVSLPIDGYNGPGTAMVTFRRPL